MATLFNSSRVLNVRSHVLEMVISGAVMLLGILIGLQMNDSSSGLRLLSGSALLMAGVVGFVLAIKSILKY